MGSSPTSRTSKLVLLSLFLGLLPVVSLVVAPPANAATVTASGPHASPSVCNQTVGNATNVVAYRLAGGDCVVEFKNAGATTTWTVPDSASSVQYLIVGGGASGTRGICGVYWGQGGGGGEVLTGNRNVTPGVSETIVVGSGGARSGACPALGNRGETSTFSTLTARPGQPGNNIQANNAGRFGGTSGNGNAGGEGTANGSSCSGGSCGTGGGGGAGGAGGVGDSRNGGAGLSSSITGSSLGYGGGGAGSNGTRGTASDGGSTGGDAAANRGGGGADGNGIGDFGGAGGSGIVIIRYTPDTTAPSLSSASIPSTGTTISLNYNETLSTTTAAAARFTVTRGGSETVTVSSVAISDSSLTLNLASTIYLGQSITVSYSDPTVGSDDANAIQDLAGNDAASFTNQSVTNNSTITTPIAPTIGTPTAGNGQVTVSWTAPASNGGASITDYVVQYSSDAGSTWTTFSDGVSTSTSAIVTGLTAGIAYKFRVSAVNGAGTGTVSDSSVVRIPQLSGATACGTAPGTGNPYQIHGGGSPSNEICNKAFDNDTSTKYLNWGGSSQNNGANDVGSIGGLNTSVLIDLKSAWAVTKVGLTTANDYSNRDPVKFELYGSNTSLSAGWNLVDSSSTLSPPGTLCTSSCTGRFTDYADETVNSPGSYRYYKLKFTQTRSPSGGYDPLVAVSEIRLYGNQVSALSVTYNTQGGSAIETGSTLANGTIEASPGSPTRTGYTFGGWSASQNGSAISFPYAHGQSSNFSLYALWASTLGITTPVSGLSGRYGSSYSLTVSTSGGSGGNTFAIASGVLPTGLTLNASTGLISGTPTQIVSAPITISVTDSSTASVTTSTFSIVISKGTQSITLSSLGTSSKTYPYSQALSMSTSGKSGTGAVTYSIAAGGTATGCALSDSTSATATLSASTSGTCLIAATVATDTNYESATSTSLTFTFSKASQSSLAITTSTIAYGEVLALSTSGGSGSGSLSFAKVSGTCSV
ncbi:MAG: hypothetical protein EBX97_01830, partial [Actinobacteria bacterium]|nr:hypothetical protein [Actinomycetota bacterium]